MLKVKPIWKKIMKASKFFIAQWKYFQESVEDISKFYRKEIQ